MGWFRSYDGISTDAKYLLIAQRSGQPVGDVVAVWLHVLDMANQRDTSERGMVDHIDVEALAAFLQRPVEDIEAILTAMRAPKRDGSPGMIAGDRVTAWRKRQPLREDDGAAERKRRQRDREREEASQRDDASSRIDTPSPNVSRDVTQCHALQEETRQEEKDSPHTPLTGGVTEGEIPRRERRKPLGEPQGFAEFYAAYPRHVARPDAAKAFGRALQRATHETIMLGLERAKAAWRRRRTETEHIPHPASWLNSDRWADEDGKPVPPPKPNGSEPFGHLSRWEQTQLKQRAEEQVRSEGQNPHTSEGMARVGQIMRESADAQRRTA